MTERDSDNDARGEGRARDFLGVVLALAVAAALGMLTLFLLFGWLHCPLGESGAIACDHREGIELVAIPVGVIAGVLLWQRFEVTTRVEASRIGPWLPSLVVGVLIGASYGGPHLGVASNGRLVTWGIGGTVQRGYGARWHSVVRPS